jgi:2-oxoisovalerate dehydrogenase E1 component
VARRPRRLRLSQRRPRLLLRQNPLLSAAAPVAAGDGEPITMPFGDLTISEGTIVGWLKKEGDAVKAGEIVAEIETDKAVVEIEAPVDGTLGPIEQPKGTVVPMGGRIGSVRR